MEMFKEAGVNIFETIIDRPLKIGDTYANNKSKNSCKGIIVRFTTSFNRTIVYRAKKNMKDSLRVILNLTKKLYNLITLQTNLLVLYNRLKFVT